MSRLEELRNLVTTGALDEEKVEQLSVRYIRPNPFQPRKVFDEHLLKELSLSIEEHGILQPIIVRKNGGFYEIVAGERRFRATKMAMKSKIPAVVRELSDREMIELGTLENLQREDLSPIEEAQAYDKMMKELSLTQEQVAKRLGKSRPHVANHLRLLNLPEEIQAQLITGELSMGHGRALLGLKRKRLIPKVAKKILKEAMNVRQLEQLVHSLNEDVPRETGLKKKDLLVLDLEGQLRDYFGTNVSISKTKNKGKIEIEFFSDEDLERILTLFHFDD